MTKFATEAKFSLSANYKCGELSYCAQTDEALFHCIFCGLAMAKLKVFVNHIKQMHIQTISTAEGEPSRKQKESLVLNDANKSIIETIETSANPTQYDPLRLETAYNDQTTHKADPLDTAIDNSTIKLEDEISDDAEAPSKLADESFQEDCKSDLSDNEILAQLQRTLQKSYPADKDSIQAENNHEREEHVSSSAELSTFTCDSDTDDNIEQGKMSNVSMSKRAVLELIRQWEKHPNLWRISADEYYSIKINQDSYDSITTELQTLCPFDNISKLWVRQKINYLLDKFRKCKNDANFAFSKSVYYGRMQFLTQSKRKIYTFKPNEEGLFACDICPAKFNKRCSLSLHIKRHNKEYTTKCDVCDKPFYNGRDLRRHATVHTNERQHICEICGKAFRLREQCKLHLKRHSNERNHKCPICPKSFYTPICLKDHMATHSDKATEKCETCGKFFKTKHNLKIHMKIHNTVKGYPCKLCDKAFSQSSQRSMHMRKHKI